MGRVLVLAFVIGVPMIFAVVTAITMFAEVSVWQAVLVALLPTFFIGPYFGGLVAMGRTSASHDAPTARVSALPKRGLDRAA